MARQIGDIIITGTIDDITFYEMDGKGYARHKSSLTGKRVKKDPRFKRTMQSAHRLGRGSQLASKVYRSLPKTEQVYNLFKELKRIAILAIKEGKGEMEVLRLLQQHLPTPAPAKAAEQTMPQNNSCKRVVGVGPYPTPYRVNGGRSKPRVCDNAPQPFPARKQRRRTRLLRLQPHSTTNLTHPNNTYLYGQCNAGSQAS